MSTKLILVTGLSLTVGFALPRSAAAGDVSISAGGCIAISGVTCTGSGSSAPPITIGSGSSSSTSSPSDPFAGVTDFAGGADGFDGSAKISVDGGPSFDHVNGLAFGKVGATQFMVVSDTVQGVVFLPTDMTGVDISGITTLPTGIASAPTGVVVADLDGDGNDDIIAVDGPDQYLSVMFGKSDGTFMAPVLVPLSSSPTQFVFADVDGDGHPDLLVPDAAAGTLDVYINDGHGGFAAATPKAAGTRPFSIAGADLDGDGDVDLVVGDGDDSLSVLLNDGHGAFISHNYSTNGVHPDRIYLGTMVNSAVFASVTDAADDAGAFFQGKGDGSFAPAVLNDGGNCATTICATATPASSGAGHGTSSKPSKPPVAAAASSGGGGDLGLLGLMLLGIAGLLRRLTR